MATDLKDVLSPCPRLEFMINGTERPINRLQDKEDCTLHYKPPCGVDPRGESEISRVRIEMEHHIGSIKRCQTVVQKFCNVMAHDVNGVMETACGLHNLRRLHRQKRMRGQRVAA